MIENLIIVFAGLGLLCAFFILGEIAAKFFDWK